MRIQVYASGFELTPHVRSFVESRVLSALGSFPDHVTSADVYVEARQGRTQSLAAVCTIVVSLHPQGDVHARAESVRMNTAIDRACSEIRSQVERVVSQKRREAVPPPAAKHEHRDRALETEWNENRMSPQREPLPIPDHYLRSVRGREYWKPSGVEGHLDSPAAIGVLNQPTPSDVVEEASQDSFPASDAPAWTPVMGAVIAKVGDAGPSALPQRGIEDQHSSNQKDDSR